MGNHTTNPSPANADDRSEEFEANVIEHMDLLYAVALKMTRNPEDAKDLVQNTIVKALRFHSKFKQGTYIKAWLLTILRNTFINEYRSKARRPLIVAYTGVEPTREDSPDPGMPFLSSESTETEMLECLGEEVNSAIGNLPANYRIPVIMADLEDKSYKEIADRMGCPLGTVMSRLYRGREILREKLRAYALDTRVLVS